VVVSPAPAARSPSDPELISRIAARTRELASAYRPPVFAEVPGPDAALFLCAIDHRTGYRQAHPVDGQGPYEGSDLLWHLGCAAEQRQPGALSAAGLADVGEPEVAETFRIGGETVTGAGTRARLWRDLAAGLCDRYEGSAGSLLAAAEGRLGGERGLIARLAAFEAYSDPLAKKSFLFAKIAERRGWITVSDPESWEVCADNVLMRLALRSGLVPPAEPEMLRAATRAAFKRLAEEAEIDPPLLDDMLWELGRRDPDLLGTAGGADLREPQRPDGTLFY
jgi:hypothetical protein